MRYNIKDSNTQGYRSGHNEAVLKTVWGNPRGFESHTLRHFGVEMYVSAPFLCPFQAKNHVFLRDISLIQTVFAGFPASSFIGEC